jgi:GGDEF domain-containing protein
MSRPLLEVKDLKVEFKLHGTVVDHPSRTMAAASSLLKDNVRWADSIGRFVDWEFLLVLPETTAVAALKLSQKIRVHVGKHNEALNSAPLAVQFGVVEWGRGDDESMLLRRAQLALNRSVAS